MNTTSPTAETVINTVPQIDQQVTAILNTRVPAVTGNNIGADFARLQKDAKQWPAALRHQVTDLMQTIISTAGNFQDSEPGMETMDTPTLVAAIKNYQHSLGNLNNNIKIVNDATGTFHTTMGEDISALNTDFQTIQGQISADENNIASLNRQIDNLNEDLKLYYEANPPIMTEQTYGTPELLTNILTLQSQLNDIQHRIDLVNQVKQQLAPLLNAVGPLKLLIPLVSGLMYGLTNLQTGIDEVYNKVFQMSQLVVAGPIAVADLKTILQELTSACQIAAQILQKTAG